MGLFSTLRLVYIVSNTISTAKAKKESFEPWRFRTDLAC